MNVGILDLGKVLDGCSAGERIRRTVEMAQLAETHGFLRYWIAEHHVPATSLAAPEIALAVLASETQRIKLGPGGVLLRYYSPLKIAETYLTLEAAFPGRIELGVCRGPGVTSDRIELALVGGHLDELSQETFEAKLDELFFLLDAMTPRPDWLGPRPIGVTPPPIWVLGSGERSASQAMRHAAPYGFMCFLPGSNRVGPSIVRRYRSEIDDPPVDGPLIAVSVTCFESEAHAKLAEEERMRRGMRSNIVGDPIQCARAIRAFADTYNVNDVLVTCPSSHAEDHVNTIRLLGEAFADATQPSLCADAASLPCGNRSPVSVKRS